MNKFRVGQRVKIIRTGKIGFINNIDNEDFSENGSSNHCYHVNFEDDKGYFTVYDIEEKEEILNKKEKEYLNNVIKPFRDRVHFISKVKIDNSQCIEISVKNSVDFFYDYMRFPPFKKDTMYKKMIEDEIYDLEELELNY